MNVRTEELSFTAERLTRVGTGWKPRLSHPGGPLTISRTCVAAFGASPRLLGRYSVAFLRRSLRCFTAAAGALLCCIPAAPPAVLQRGGGAAYGGVLWAHVKSGGYVVLVFHLFCL